MRAVARRSGWVLMPAVFCVVLTACAASGGDGQGSGDLRVVASFYPLAEAARRVGGDAVAVENLTPAGVEPHDLELTPDDLELLQGADVVVLVGGGFQPAVEEAVEDAEGLVVDVLAGLEALPPLEEEGHEDEELAADPHVWLDPALFAQVVEKVATALSESSPGDADAFERNADAYVAELEALDRDYAEGLETCEDRLMVVNHAAFGYLARAYDLEQEPISGISPEAEPDPGRLAELAALVEREGVTTVFTEELASPEVAEALAREAGVGTAVLNPLEGLTKEEIEAGEDYLSVMRTNLETLRSGLGCD